MRFDLPDLARTTADPSNPFALEPAVGRIALHLYVKKELSRIQRELALAGFLLSQVAGGPFRELFVGERTKAAVDLSDCFAHWGWTETCLAFPQAFLAFFADESKSRAAADHSLNAALLLSAVDAVPIPARWIETASRESIGLLLRFAPDSQFDEI